MPINHLSATLHRFAARAGAQSSKVTRKDFTDRLGLPADATNDQVLAAVDAVKKPKAPTRTLAQRRQAADDALYASIYGPAAS